MKILFVTHGADMMGANRSLMDLINGLQSYGVKSSLLLPEKGEFSEHLNEKKTPYFIHKYYKWAFTKYISKDYWIMPFRRWQNKNNLEEIIKNIEPHQFDIIYSNTSVIGIGAQLAHRLNIHHVWHIREFAEKHYNASFIGGRKRFHKWCDKSSAIIAISEAIKNGVLDEISAPKHVIYDGVIGKKDLEKIQANSNHENDPFVFLIIGLIHPSKGQLLALQAFYKIHQQNPNTKLLIVGTGRRVYTYKIKQFIKKHRLNNVVHLLGYVKNPYSIHAQADCVLMCSKFEGLGRVTVEAMIFGNPVIGYNGGATPELIEHKKNGLLYTNGIDELSKHMLLLANDRKLAAHYGKEGRKIAEKFIIDSSAFKEYQIFCQILEKK